MAEYLDFWTCIEALLTCFGGVAVCVVIAWLATLPSTQTGEDNVGRKSRTSQRDNP